MTQQSEKQERCGVANSGGTPCTKDKFHPGGHDQSAYGPPPQQEGKVIVVHAMIPIGPGRSAAMCGSPSTNMTSSIVKINCPECVGLISPDRSAPSPPPQELPDTSMPEHIWAARLDPVRAATVVDERYWQAVVFQGATQYVRADLAAHTRGEQLTESELALLEEARDLLLSEESYASAETLAKVIQRERGLTPPPPVSTAADWNGLNLFRQIVGGGKNALRELGVFACNDGEHGAGCKCFWEQCEPVGKK